MNWYKFKIELLSVVTGTALLTLSTVVLLSFSVDNSGMTSSHPLWMRPAINNPDVVAFGFGVALGLLWLCRWKIFRVLRDCKAYGER